MAGVALTLKNKFNLKVGHFPKWRGGSSLILKYRHYGFAQGR